MPRRAVLSAAERRSLVEIPTVEADLHHLYGLSDADLGLINERRGAGNRLGFTVLMPYMRYPGIVLGVDEDPAPQLLTFLAEQLGLPVEAWDSYGARAETRREHVLDLQTVLGFTSFTLENHHAAIESLTETAMVNDRGLVVAEELVDSLRQRRILLPSLLVVEKICAEAITRGNRAVYATLTEGLGSDQDGVWMACFGWSPGRV